MVWVLKFFQTVTGLLSPSSFPHVPSLVSIVRPKCLVAVVRSGEDGDLVVCHVGRGTGVDSRCLLSFGVDHLNQKVTSNRTPETVDGKWLGTLQKDQRIRIMCTQSLGSERTLSSGFD